MEYKHIKHIVWIIIVFLLIGCTASKYAEESEIMEVFPGYAYDFLESFGHQTDINEYSNMPFDLKFGGINPDNEYLWLRDSNHLRIAFNTFNSIGLDQFVSIQQYNTPDDRWCCNTQWEGKSLNQVVHEFIESDTSGIKDGSYKDYFAKFWNRRRAEGNLQTTYDILVKIDQYYNKGMRYGNQNNIDTVLSSLLNYDLRLLNADSVSYTSEALVYYEYLKSVKLYNSAYALIFNYSGIHLTRDELCRIHDEMIDQPLSVSELCSQEDGWFDNSNSYLMKPIICE